MAARDILLTGIPRSGLTLAGALIDSFSDAVCLNEPYMHRVIAAELPARKHAFSKWVFGEFHYIRQQILRSEPVRDFRAPDGSHLLDGVFDARNPGTPDIYGRMAVPMLWPNMPKDFRLAIKHHAMYTAPLEVLLEHEHFHVVAIVRNPVDVITSWRKLAGYEYSEGRLPVEAENFWQPAHTITKNSDDTLTRMVQLYELFCERYYTLRDKITILKYENMVRSPELLSQAIGREGVPPSSDKIRMRQATHMANTVQPLREKLRQYGVFTKQFYPDF